MNQYNISSIKNNTIRILFIIMILIVIGLYMTKLKSGLVTGILISNSTFTIATINNQKIQCIVYFQERSGRLGNRMFMVASAYGLARLHFCHLYLTPETITEMQSVFIFDLSPLLISITTFNSIVHNPSISMTKKSRSITCQYVPELTRPNAIAPGDIFELKHYWQSYLHFTKYNDDIRQRIFSATQSILQKVSNLFVDIYKLKLHSKPKFSLDNHQLFKKQLAQSNWTTWIGVHVRRSDFVALQFSSSDEYLVFAIEYYIKRYPNAHFIVASDDKRYCRKLFHNRANFFLTPESFSMGEDLIALSLCEHSIVTGGTFGWWTAYLTNGHVIHDKVYPSGCERREYYYPPWFMIPGNVRAQKYSNYTL
ncbi:unnamed protein product [Rotaria magnacalcarata]|uniref:L-Fucosyltransferase n=2 Tax=Rotaria magnacalcarata TaxID=392030 RepID=A0A819FVU6_9BILA|nr:unnamed protein product [Rotaria magnacalcarata]